MKLFLFILDGCSAAELKAANTPFIDEISNRGKYTLECEAVFPTATYTGHSTIITGNYPEKHGMVGNQFWDRKNQCIRNFDFFDPNENIGSPTIFELLPFRTCAICEPVTKGANLIVKKKIFDEIPIKNQNLSVNKHLLKNITAKFQFYLVNFMGVDSFGETEGPKSEEYLQCLEEIDGLLLDIKNKLHSDFIFIITADHGMTTVKENIDLEEELKNDGFQVKCLASHRCSHIYVNSNLQELEKHLYSLPFIDRVFNSTGLEGAHLNHERTGDLVVCAKKGFEFGGIKLKGSHGGFTDDEIFVPFIIYDSTDKIEDKISLESMNLVDICPTIMSIFNIKTNIQFQGKSLYRQR